MLTLVKIKNIALIDDLAIEFGPGLNVLTGETGSGKSIVVDSLGALTGERVSATLIKEGRDSARIEGVFVLADDERIRELCESSGIELEPGEIELIVRRELSATGKNRVFVNDQLVTGGFLKKIGTSLVDIHSQGEQASLFDAATHLKVLDDFAGSKEQLERTAAAFREWNAVRTELGTIRQNEAEKLQMLDILRFQIDEIAAAALKPDEQTELEEEMRRLNNVEKLSSLSAGAFGLLYENEGSALENLEKARLLVTELTDYERKFGEYDDGLETAHAVLEDLAFALRDFKERLEFSPGRLNEIGDRLAAIGVITRKYGGSVEAALAHLKDAEEKCEQIETAEFREEELRKREASLRNAYIAEAEKLHRLRTAAAGKFSAAVESGLKAVALEKARFEVRVERPSPEEMTADTAGRAMSASGFDSVEFFFSANAGESPKPLGKVASGGEAARVMLVIKTTGKDSGGHRTSIFDEVDTGIGGRVAEAVGQKLRTLAANRQVLCVTHQPQVASKADRHFLIEKSMSRNATVIGVRELGPDEQVEEIARMLAGETVTDAARSNAREMLAGA